MNISNEVNYKSKCNPPNIVWCLIVNHDSPIPKNGLDNTVATWAISAAVVGGILGGEIHEVEGIHVFDFPPCLIRPNGSPG